VPAPALYEPALTVSTMPPVRIGTVDIPERVDRARYFGELSYLELSALFAGPLKTAALARWKEVAPDGALGLVAPWVFTHRKPPRADHSWRHDSSVGDFRDSAPARDALLAFQAAVTLITPAHVVFKSPPLFAPSVANRDQLRRFFAEVVPDVAGVSRVWIPDGLWEPRAAVAFAGELGVTCAIDPLVHDPNQPGETYEDIEAPALYFRIDGLGQAGALRSEKLEDLAALVEHYQDIDLTIAFCSPARWQDARNFKKLLAGVAS
jgi:Protein of unknown function DUF72